MGRDRFRFNFINPRTSRPAARTRVLAERAEDGAAEQVELAPYWPRLTPRDEAVYLLHATAEVEHSLMVQYLYSSFSLRDEAPARDWAETILGIAREEMGHLACMQNVLLLLGGPVNFEREDFPFRTGLYPFPLQLEPLTLGSLAKYIAAERPAVITDPTLDALYHEEIEPLTRAEADDEPVNRVGAVFERLLLLFRDPASVPEGDPTPPLQDEDFRTDAGPALATLAEWGRGDPGIIIGPAPEEVGTPPAVRSAIRDVLTRIAQQGEGYPSASPGDSHFDRFISVWQAYRANYPQAPVNDTGPGSPALPAPTNPTPNASVGRHAITNENAKQWAHLFNVRYRMLLAALQHFFEFTPPFAFRGTLTNMAFEEMRRVARIAKVLVNRPLGSESLADRAGPPFELPYALTMPDRERDRWRTHRDAVDSSIQLCEWMIPNETTDPDFLTRLLGADRERRARLTRLMDGLPPDPQATPREAFLALLRTKQPRAANDHFGIDTPSGALQSLFELEKYDDIERFLLTGDAVLLDPPRKLVVPGRPEESGFFLQITEGVMQGRFTDDEIEVVRRWVLSLPATPTGPLGFAADIRPLFRDSDVAAMSFVFDLSKFEDVRDNAEAIHSRLADGSMPCDGPWPPERIALFRRWIDEGMQP